MTVPPFYIHIQPSTIEVSDMRLTLRTLLAWLDDTLQPTQVREIGSQVAESPFAQELTERIHRVTRHRRLSVPSSSGAGWNRRQRGRELPR